MDFSSLNSLKTCLKLGLGIGILPLISIEKELEQKQLFRINFDEETLETSVIMIWHAQKWCSPVLSRFMDITKNQMTP